MKKEKWEYKTIEVDLDGEPGDDLREKMESFLNRVAEVGWEFVQYVEGTFPFFVIKREKVLKRGRPRKTKE